MGSPNKLTLNTNPLQYKRARSKGVNKISKISRVSKIKKIATNDKNTENMAYTPFKMKGPSLYKSPAKDKGTSHFAQDRQTLGEKKYQKVAASHDSAYGSGHTKHGEQNPKKENKTSPAKKYDSPAKDTRYFGENDMGRDGNMNAIVAHNEKHDKDPKWDHSKKKERKKKMDAASIGGVAGSVPKKPAPTKQTISMNQPQGKKGTKENVAAHKKNEAETISKSLADGNMTADEVNAQLAKTRHLKAEKEVKVKSDPNKKYPKNEKQRKVRRTKSKRRGIKLPKSTSTRNLVTGGTNRTRRRTGTTR